MTGSVVPPTTISDEAVELAARALREATVQGRESWSISTWEDYADPARAVVAAVAPDIEAGLREQISDEILATLVVGGTGLQVYTNGAIKRAARVARGTQEATK